MTTPIAKPTHDPRWADSDSSIDRPSAGLRATGYVTQVLTSKGHNGVLHEANEWLAYLADGHTPTVDALEGVHFLADAGTLVAGDPAIVRVPATARGSSVLATLDSVPRGVCADARRVYASRDSELIGLARADGAEEWVSAFGGTGNEGPCATDGANIVIVSAGGEAKVYEVDGTVGSTLVTTFGGPISGAAIRGSRFAICGPSANGLDTNDASIRVADVDDGGQVWRFDETETYDIVMHGGRVWSSGLDGADYKLRRFTTESATPEQTQTNVTNGPTKLAHDGERLYLAVSVSGGANSLRCVAPFSLNTTIWQRGSGADDGYTHITVDQRYVYAVRAGGSILRALDKLTGIEVDQVSVASGIVDITCDGQFVYVAATGGGNRIHRVRIGSDRARMWTVADTSDLYRPFGWSLIPE